MTLNKIVFYFKNGLAFDFASSFFHFNLHHQFRSKRPFNLPFNLLHLTFITVSIRSKFISTQHFFRFYFTRSEIKKIKMLKKQIKNKKKRFNRNPQNFQYGKRKTDQKKLKKKEWKWCKFYMWTFTENDFLPQNILLNDHLMKKI